MWEFNISQPYRPPRPVTGIALLLLFCGVGFATLRPTPNLEHQGISLSLDHKLSAMGILHEKWMVCHYKLNTTAMNSLFYAKIIQGVYKRMVQFQKLLWNLFLILQGHNIQSQQRKLSKFLMRYQQSASHSYCGPWDQFPRWSRRG
jgi:hypothetical protein